jgi:hypothetical protein
MAQSESGKINFLNAPFTYCNIMLKYLRELVMAGIKELLNREGI